MSTSTTVSFKQYGDNAAENYERYFVPTIGMPFATALLDAVELHRGQRVLGAVDFAVYDQGKKISRKHLHHVIRWLRPYLRRREEEQTLVPVVVVLMQRLEAVGRATNRHFRTEPFNLIDRAGIRQRAF